MPSKRENVGKSKGKRVPKVNEKGFVNEASELDVTPCNMELDLNISGKYLTPEGNEHGDYVVKTRGKRVHKRLNKDTGFTREICKKKLEAIEEFEEDKSAEVISAPKEEKMREENNKKKRGKQEENHVEEKLTEKPKVEVKKTKVVKKVENGTEKTVANERPKRVVKKNSEITIIQAQKKIKEKPKKVNNEKVAKKKNVSQKTATNASKKDPKMK